MHPLKQTSRYFLIRVFLFVALSFSVSAYAGNEHEHLTYIPQYVNLNAGFEGKLGDLDARKLLSGHSESLFSIYESELASEFLNAEELKALSEISEPAERSVFLRSHMTQILKKKPVHFVIEKIQDYYLKKTTYKGPRDYSFFEKSLFELTPEVHPNLEKAYLCLGGIRTSLSFNNHAEMMKAIEHTIARQPIHEILKVGLSVPRQLFEKDFLNSVRHIYEKAGGNVEFFYSIPRRVLLTEPDKVDQMLETMKHAIAENWGHGIDISGSIIEGSEKKLGITDGSLAKSLKKVFQFTAKQNIPLKIHAFEGSNDGDFYHAFWRTLRDCKLEGCLPDQIRIGHINQLSYRDILRFHEFEPKSKFVFEVNIASNEIAQKGSYNLKKIMTTLEELKKNNFPVTIGSDGFGILGEPSSFLSTLKRLRNNGLSHDSLEWLIQNSSLPNYNQKLSKTNLLRWQRVRETVRTALGFSSPQPETTCGRGRKILNQVFAKKQKKPFN